MSMPSIGKHLALLWVFPFLATPIESLACAHHIAVNFAGEADLPENSNTTLRFLRNASARKRTVDEIIETRNTAAAKRTDSSLGSSAEAIKVLPLDDQQAYARRLWSLEMYGQPISEESYNASLGSSYQKRTELEIKLAKAMPGTEIGSRLLGAREEPRYAPVFKILKQYRRRKEALIRQGRDPLHDKILEDLAASGDRYLRETGCLKLMDDLDTEYAYQRIAGATLFLRRIDTLSTPASDAFNRLPHPSAQKIRRAVNVVTPVLGPEITVSMLAHMARNPKARDTFLSLLPVNDEWNMDNLGPAIKSLGLPTNKEIAIFQHTSALVPQEHSDALRRIETTELLNEIFATSGPIPTEVKAFKTLPEFFAYARKLPQSAAETRWLDGFESGFNDRDFARGFARMISSFQELDPQGQTEFRFGVTLAKHYSHARSDRLVNIDVHRIKHITLGDIAADSGKLGGGMHSEEGYSRLLNAHPRVRMLNGTKEISEVVQIVDELMKRSDQSPYILNVKLSPGHGKPSDDPDPDALLRATTEATLRKPSRLSLVGGYLTATVPLPDQHLTGTVEVRIDARHLSAILSDLNMGIEVVSSNEVKKVMLPRAVFNSKGWEGLESAYANGNGLPGVKTLFPPSWDESKIKASVRYVINFPSIVRKMRSIKTPEGKAADRYLITGDFEGVRVTVGINTETGVDQVYPDLDQPNDLAGMGFDTNVPRPGYR